MKLKKSSSNLKNIHKKGLSLVLHFLEKVALFPNFEQNKLAMLPKLGHENRASGNREVLSYHANWKTLSDSDSKDTIWKRCPISMAKFWKPCQFTMSKIRKRCYILKGT